MTRENAINNRYEFTILFDVKNGNPNGDPDADGRPRTDIETELGIITDTCIKRKIRNYVQLRHAGEEGYNIYVNRDETLNAKDFRAIKALDAAKPAKEDEEEFVIGFMCDNYFDTRTFGSVMTGFTKDAKNPDDTEKRKIGNASQLNGPVQIEFAESFDKATPVCVTVTRMAATNEERASNSTEIGNKWIIPYALYRVDGHISANQAKKTGFSEKDLEVLWDAILNMFEEDHAAARGKMVVRDLIIFKHESAFGNAPSQKVLDTVKVRRKDNVAVPRNFDDYEITLPTNDDMPNGVTVEVRS